MTKIILINDNSWYGGAEITNDSIITEGLNRNYDITVYVYGKKERDGNRRFNPPKADLYIIANYGYIPHEELLKFISNNKYIRFFHDIPGFIAQIPSSFHNGSEAVLSQLINKAEHNFMISPMQHGVINNRIKLPDNKITIVPPYIPLHKFNDKGEERLKNSWLYLGDVSPARGIERSLQVAINNHGEEFIIAGPEVYPNYVSTIKQEYDKFINITYLGEVKYDKVNDLMNMYQNFIYTPEIYDSFCRKVVEAQAAGMTVHVDNRRIGVYSYPSDYDVVKGVLSANTVLWDKIDSIINGSSNTVINNTVTDNNNSEDTV